MPHNMKLLKRIVMFLLVVFAIPLTYIVVDFLLSAITVNKEDNSNVHNNRIYLFSNGVHLDIAIPKSSIDANLLSGLENIENGNYLSFGWGDKGFYLDTPTWSELKFSTAFRAGFMKSTTLMHVTKYGQQQGDWIEIMIDDQELKLLNDYIFQSFNCDEQARKIILPNKGYSAFDNFYKANGSYSLFKTCNTWLNTGFKRSGLKACYWTAFDRGLLKKYK